MRPSLWFGSYVDITAAGFACHRRQSVRACIFRRERKRYRYCYLRPRPNHPPGVWSVLCTGRRTGDEWRNVRGMCTHLAIVGVPVVTPAVVLDEVTEAVLATILHDFLVLWGGGERLDGPARANQEHGIIGMRMSSGVGGGCKILPSLVTRS